MKEIELSVNKYTHVYPSTGTSIIIFSTTVIFQRRVSKKNSTSTETYLNLYTRCGSMYICWYVYAHLRGLFISIRLVGRENQDLM